MWLLYAALGLLALFLTVLVLRALFFQPKAQPSSDAEPVTFDREAAVSALQQLVRCRTVSTVDPQLENDAEFEKLDQAVKRMRVVNYTDHEITVVVRDYLHRMGAKDYLRGKKIETGTKFN